jgi:hypothetical protein
MKTTLRAVLSGSMVWAFVFSIFAVFSFIPGIKDSQMQQGLIVGAFMLPFAYLGASFHYKKGDKTHGLTIGFIMVAIALVLDALITVPFVEIPYHGSSYVKFYTNPLLWIIVVENMAIIYLYWKLKIKSPIIIKSV